MQYQIQQTLSQYPELVQVIMILLYSATVITVPDSADAQSISPLVQVIMIYFTQQQLVQYQIQQTLSQYPELVHVIMILLYSATVSAVPDAADAQSISSTCTGNYDTTVLSNSQYSTRFSRRSVNIQHLYRSL